MRSSVLCVGLLIAMLGLFAIPAQAQTLTNPDFENWTGDDPDGWLIAESGNNIREDAFAFSGSSSCELVCISNVRPRLIQYLSVDPNEQVTAEVFVYDNDNSYTRLYVKVYDELDNLLMQEFNESYNTGSWQSLSVDYITPGNSDYIKFEIIYFYNTSFPGVQTNYIDLCSVTIAVPTVPNLKNPGFEDWTGTEPDSWSVIETGDDEVQEENTIVNSGLASCSMTSVAFTRPRVVQLLTIRPGDTIKGSMEILDDDPSLPRLYLRAYNSESTLIAQAFGGATDNPAWQTVSATLTLPTSTAYARYEIIQFWDSGTGGSQTIYLDDAEFWIDTYTYDVSNANTWYFMGVPCTIALAANRNADALFSDDLGGDSEEDTWVMSRWNNTTHVYDRFGNGDGDPLTEPPDIEPGLGYFFVQDVEPGVSDPWLDITSLQTTAGSPQSNVNQTIVGYADGLNGRTMLANPFYGDYGLSSSVLTVEGDPSGWGQDGINANIYAWGGTQYLVQLAVSSQLDSWEGFYVVKTTSGDADIEMVFDADEHGPSIDEIDSFLDYGWTLDLHLESIDGVFRDDYNKLGTRGISKDGYDGWDAFELTPPASQYVSLAFSHSDWDEGTRFAHDFRDKDDSDESWDIEVIARHLPGETFRLYWPGIPGMPDEIELWLYEITLDGYTPIGRLRDLEDYEFTVGNNSTEIVNLRIRAINTNAADTVVDEDGTLLPAEFGIHDAYPNPFNAQITVKTGLPETGEMSLKLYDILGREVVTLYSGQLHGGLHNFSWNADGHASGIYFLRMTAGDQVTHRKITLLQ